MKMIFFIKKMTWQLMWRNVRAVELKATLQLLVIYWFVMCQGRYFQTLLRCFFFPRGRTDGTGQVRFPLSQKKLKKKKKIQSVFGRAICFFTGRCYVYNIFITNHKWLVVIDSNLKLTLRLFFCLNNNN